MKEKLLGFALEYLLTKETAKKFARLLNAKLQAVAAVGDGKARIAGYLRDAMLTLATYSGAVADDGHISDAELAGLNEQTDTLIEKYMK